MELPTPEDLRQRRKQLALTQSELADAADVSQPLIARIEGGDVDPRLSTLRRIVEGLDEAEGGVVRAADLMHDDVVAVAPDDAVGDAKEVMFEAGYSQLPVVRDGSPEGIISNTDIREAREGPESSVSDLPVTSVMNESVSIVEPDAPLDEIDSHLNLNPAVFVVSHGELVGVITEADIAAQVS